MKLRRIKRGELAHATDFGVGIVMLFVIGFLFLTFVNNKQATDRMILKAQLNENDAAQNFVLFFRMPMEDGRTMAEHLVDGYRSGLLLEDTEDNYISIAVYKYFNHYFMADPGPITWHLVVEEELYDPLELGFVTVDTHSYLSYNENIDQINLPKHRPEFGKMGMCGQDLKTYGVMKLPVYTEKTKNLIFELRSCRDSRVT